MTAQDRIAKSLRESIAEEAAAARAYRERARYAEESGDASTAKLYRHIAEEEDKHEKEYRDRLFQVVTQGLHARAQKMWTLVVGPRKGKTSRKRTGDPVLGSFKGVR